MTLGHISDALPFLCYSLNWLPWAAVQSAKTRWLKTTEIYCLTVFKARSPDQSATGPCCLRRLEGRTFLTSSTFWWFPAILGLPQLIDASLQSLPLLSRGLFSVCSCFHSPVFLQGHLVIMD